MQAAGVPTSHPPERGLQGPPGSALSLSSSPPRAVLTQAVREAWAGWAGAEVTPVSPADFLSIPRACGHSLGNALGWSLVSLQVGVGRTGKRDNGPGA